ncbi:MAG: porin PorA family protein [Candidatus Thermoplasmatota archaeon]|nr:porin PorA family protein [Candidatus Thermoplasmatota archaeon]
MPLGQGTIMAGTGTLMAYSWSGMATGQYIEPMDMVYDDMLPVQLAAAIDDKGLMMGDTPTLVMDMDLEEEMGRSGISPGRATKGPIKIWSRILNKTLDAEPVLERKISGRSARVYALNVVDESIENDALSGIGGIPRSIPLSMKIDMLYSDRTQYVLDDRTSIPLDIKLDIEADITFPDTRVLPVFEHQISYAKQSVTMLDQDDPGSQTTEEHIVQRHLTGIMDSDDERAALFHEWMVTIDNKTGEVVDADDGERYAVDIHTHMYLTGYKGTARSGLHQFPTGNVMERDYEMWDPISSRKNIARYISREGNGTDAPMIFRMGSSDVPVDPESLMISRIGVGGYYMDSVQTWKVSSISGTMLDYVIEGRVRLRSTGPLGAVDRVVAQFNVTFADNTTAELRSVERLYDRFLLPISGSRLVAFSLEASFTEEMRVEMADLSKKAGTYMDLAEVWSPAALIISGAALMVLIGPVFLIGYSRRRASRELGRDRDRRDSNQGPP